MVFPDSGDAVGERDSVAEAKDYAVVACAVVADNAVVAVARVAVPVAACVAAETAGCVVVEVVAYAVVAEYCVVGD